MAFNVNDIYTAALAVAGSAPATAFLVKKFGPKAAIVEAEAVRVASEAKPLVLEGIHSLEHLLKLPELAPLKLKLEHVQSELRQSQIDAVVRALLNAYPQALNELTDDQKATVVLFAQKELAKLGIEATSQEIGDALKLAQQASDAFANSDAFKQTEATVAIKWQLTTEAQQALSGAQAQPAQPAQQATA